MKLIKRDKVNLEIVNILSVIKYIASCDLLCLFDNNTTLLPAENKEGLAFINDVKLLNKITSDKIEKLKSYKELSFKYSKLSFQIIDDTADTNVALLILYFNDYDKTPAAIQNITILFNTILAIIKTAENNDIKNLNDELIETINSVSSILYSANFNNSEYNFISKSVEKIFGVSPEILYKNRYTLLRKIYPNDFNKFKDFIKKLKHGENAVVEYRYLTKDNTLGYIKHTGTPVFRNDKIVRIVGIISEITDEKQLLLKLKSAKEQFSLLLETASGLIFTLDKFGYFISINNKGANKLGYRNNEIIGRHFLEFVSEESKSDLALAFQKILSKNTSVNFETILINNFGQKLSFQIEAASLKIGGKITGMLGTGRDVSVLRKDETLFKQLNAKLTEANRIISIERNRAKEKISVLEELNRLKNDFISNVSHELRTPMASIVGFAETIATDQELPRETILEFNNIILTEGKRLAKLVNDILDFSRLETDANQLNTAKIDLIKFLKELARLYKKQAENKNIILSAELPEAEIFIDADRDRLSKAVGNIISNAVKFTASGGRVSIFAQEFLKEVEILIIDTGEGISSEDIPKLFQKFSKIDNLKEQQPGAGFGLVTTKQIVELHGGIIRVKSEPGKGSTFIIKLPKLN